MMSKADADSIAIPVGLSPSLRKNADTGSDALATIEPRATSRNTARTSRKTTSANTMPLGVSIKNDPSPVATPFPPLKRSHSGKICPAAAAKPATKGIMGWPGKRTEAAHTAPNPFMASSNSVTTPSAGDIRATFVAPMLPLPVVRTSAPRQARTSKYPKGMEPKEYPMATVIRMGCMSGSQLHGPVFVCGCWLCALEQTAEFMKDNSAQSSCIATPWVKVDFYKERTPGPSWYQSWAAETAPASAGDQQTAALACLLYANPVRLILRSLARA